jgi:membrane associated rhomboid family serine protease
MGYEDREYFRDETEDQHTFGVSSDLSWSMRLIIVNGVLFLINLLLDDHLAKGGPLFGIDLPGLGFSGQTLTRPWLWWQYLTAGFVHPVDSIIPLVFSMFALFNFGPQLEDVHGRREYLTFYMVTQTMASISMGIFLYAMGVEQPVSIGAGFAVSAVVLLFCLHFPYQQILLYFVVSIPAWLIGAFTILGLLATSGMSLPGAGRFNALSFFIAPGIVVLALTLVHFLYKVRFSDWIPSWLIGRDYARAAAESWNGPPSRRRSGGSWWNIGRWWRTSQTKKNLSVVRDDDQTDEQDVDSELEAQGDKLLEKLYRDGESALTRQERETLKRYSEMMRGRSRQR